MSAHLLSAAEAAEVALEELTAPPGPTLLSAAEAEALSDAVEVLAEARRILSQAEAEVARARASAIEAGRREGLGEVASALLMARGEYGALMHRSERDMVSLALELTRRIVGQGLETEPELLGQMVSHTLSLAQGQRHIEVLAHPDDLRRLSLARAQMEDAAGTRLLLVEDERVPPGGCRIHTEAGIIEADLDTQIEVLAEAMGVDLWRARGRGRG